MHPLGGYDRYGNKTMGKSFCDAVPGVWSLRYDLFKVIG
jgi:hypothetical protein